MQAMRAAIRLLAAAMLLHPALAGAQAVPEYELKAAFLYNFALFTEWPADTLYDAGLFHVCISASSPMRQPLAGISGKMVKGRRLVLRVTAGGESLRGCHVLMLHGADREHWAQSRKAIDGGAVLTVTDDETIAREGAIVALASEGQRLAFDINLTAGRQARLTLSSKLLRLARTVN